MSFIILILFVLLTVFLVKSRNNSKPARYVSSKTEKQIAFERLKDKAVSDAMAAMGINHWYWDYKGIDVVVATNHEPGPEKGLPILYKIKFAEISEEKVVVESILGENMKNPFIVTKPEPTIEEAAAYFANILDNDCGIISSINERIEDNGYVEISGMSINNNMKLTKNQVKGLKQAFIDKGYDILMLDYANGLYTLGFIANNTEE